GKLGQPIRTPFPIGNMFGLPAKIGYPGNDRFASDPTVGGTAEIGRVAKDEPVFRCHFTTEGRDQLILHHPKRPVAMGLEKDEQAARKSMKCLQRGRDLVRIVPEIVDQADSTGFLVPFEPATKSRKALDRFSRLPERDI